MRYDSKTTTAAAGRYDSMTTTARYDAKMTAAARYDAKMTVAVRYDLKGPTATAILLVAKEVGTAKGSGCRRSPGEERCPRCRCPW